LQQHRRCSRTQMRTSAVSARLRVTAEAGTSPEVFPRWGVMGLLSRLLHQWLD
jgi:hypothetical protein